MRILEAIARRILRDEIKEYEFQIKQLDAEVKKLKQTTTIDLTAATIIPNSLLVQIFEKVGDPNYYATFGGQLYSGSSPDKVFEFVDDNRVTWSFYFERVNHIDDYNYELVIFVFRNKTNKTKMRLKLPALKTVIDSKGSRECTTWVWLLRNSGFRVVSDNSFNVIYNFFHIEL